MKPNITTMQCPDHHFCSTSYFSIPDFSAFISLTLASLVDLNFSFILSDTKKFMCCITASMFLSSISFCCQNTVFFKSISLSLSCFDFSSSAGPHHWNSRGCRFELNISFHFLYFSFLLQIFFWDVCAKATTSWDLMH